MRFPQMEYLLVIQSILRASQKVKDSYYTEKIPEDLELIAVEREATSVLESVPRDLVSAIGERVGPDMELEQRPMHVDGGDGALGSKGRSPPLRLQLCYDMLQLQLEDLRAHIKKSRDVEEELFNEAVDQER